MVRSIRQSVADKIAALKQQFPRFQPQLAVVQAGERPDSTVYVRMKAKAAEEVGIHFQHITLPEAASVKEIVNVVKRLNDDDAISGILVQLPLGPHVDPDGVRTVTESISPEKDVDGYDFLARRKSARTYPPYQIPRIQYRSSVFSRGVASVRALHSHRSHPPSRVN